MNDTGIRAAAARNSANRKGSGLSEEVDGPAVAGVDDGGPSSGVAREIGDETLSRGALAAADRNVTAWVTQSINGLCWCNHEYPRTADAERSNMVKRNRTECCATQGRLTNRRVN